ncbi:hypothetical protein D3M61_07135 [Aliarcobacter butzleri]|uniref:hypothetical protein n=1 Tax=Aliarcobacter butzleri TaxID=28197 RepID=UPI00102D6D90|nr:hypothetical protein [Aliarcobacter butzleri]RZV13648.1 hypothetical protein D3M61_07135 [Aliarcobacter butzleri]
MIPNMARTVSKKSIPLTIKRVVKTIVKGRPVETITDIEIMGFLKPIPQDKIVKDKIDYNLEYVHYVGINEVKISDLINWNNKNYRCYSKADYSTYGFYKADLEEVKE